MLGLLGRLFLLRVLPRRLLPILTVYEAFKFVRGLRSGSHTSSPVGAAHPGTAPGPRVVGSSATVMVMAASSGAGQLASPVAGLDQYIRRSMAEWKVPGLGIAIVKDAKVVLAAGFGVRGLGRPEPVDSLTIFAIGSVTKAFTATAIGMLADDRTLALDGPVTTYLPGFQLYDPYATREVTVRDLLSHRTGVSGGDLLWTSGDLTRDDIVSRPRLIPPAWGFRARWDYSNIMVVATGQVLAAVAGTTWDEFVWRRILVPLGMTSTTSTIRSGPVHRCCDPARSDRRGAPPDCVAEHGPDGGGRRHQFERA